MFSTDISGKSRNPRSCAAISLALHSAAILFVLLLARPVADFVAHSRPVSLIAPSPPVRPEGRYSRPQVRKPRLALPPPPAQAVKLALPTPEIPQAPALDLAHPAVAVPELPRAMPPPAPTIKTGEFIPVIASAPKPAPQLSLQASGFSPADNARALVARAPAHTTTSGFETEAAETQAPRRVAVSASGFSDASPGLAIAAAPRVLARSAFGDASRQAPSPVEHKPAANPTSPVDILSKPRPAYTAEARALGLEGEVLIEVTFEAGGTARVLRVLKGLGHGLDESAVAAAREIRFRPARRDGQAVDATAVVHILFQLAQ